MTHDPLSNTPPPLPTGAARDPGDAWVEGPNGQRYWGRFGAAGLLAWHHQAGILLQHRAVWSHHGGTWGLPGGARKQHESAHDAALREAYEEAGVPDDAVTPLFESELDLGFWSYTTVAVKVERLFAPTRRGCRERRSTLGATRRGGCSPSASRIRHRLGQPCRARLGESGPTASS